MTWLVPHAAEVITKYMMGKDGKPPLERHSGKQVREELLEFGERVYYKVRKSAVKDLEPRWLSGIWLGRRWGSHAHLVYSQLNKVVESYAIQRRPMAERWSREEIEGVKTYPWDWELAGVVVVITIAFVFVLWSLPDY